MKRIIAGVVMAAMVSGLGTMSVFAAGTGWRCDHGDGSYAHTSCAYVDANGDGICDNCSTVAGGYWHEAHYYVDANNDGICDHYVDANNDGICDNYANNTCPGYGAGYGHGRHHGGHHR